MKNPWHYLALLIVGVFLFEFTSEIIIYFNVDADYGSVPHRVLSGFVMLGLMFGVIALLELYLMAKQQCDTAFI